MLEITRIRAERQDIVKALEKRQIGEASELVDRIIILDDDRKSTQTKNDELLAEANQLSKTIGQMMKEGRREEAESIKQRSADLKSESKSLTEKQNSIDMELQQLLYKLPNTPNSDVPAGASEENNEIVYEHGVPPQLGEDAKPHWELIKQYDIVDFDLGNKVTGAGFPFYKGKGARLQRALINFFLDEAVKRGFVEVQPPIMINEDSGYATGQLPDKDGQMYHVKEENYFLIPTAEVPITNMYRDVIVDTDKLPIKHVGFTPCFRREAGSWGAHVRGLNRLHQFDKVEIVQIQHPEKSYDTLKEMSEYVQELLQKLELPYRVLNLCAGDLGFTSAQTYDMEVFSAAQQMWLEVSSVSNFETYQANRLKLRYRGDDKKTQLLHTLNGSALALPRIIAAILENNQSPEGIKIPEILVPYTGFDTIS